jgi:hypothetical protein
VVLLEGSCWLVDVGLELYVDKSKQLASYKYAKFKAALNDEDGFLVT